ncbi:MAG: WG repeat-containing protein, partial [Phocaeicola sp.]|nr:WG repeat-containing protein [Phocaeicola sp.]
MKKNFLVSLFMLFPLLVLGQSLEIKPDKKGKLGYFDSDGNKVISCQYEEAEPFVNGVARVRKNGKYGLINEKGKAMGGLKYTVMDEYADTGYYI